jgi:hypothetical protein
VLRPLIRSGVESHVGPVTLDLKRAEVAHMQTVHSWWGSPITSRCSSGCFGSSIARCRLNRTNRAYP